MAERFDATARLAQGRPVVADLQTYVWACHLVGYQNPDLTLHPSHVDDWYGSEDGLDLRALDADCGALRAAAAATEEALARQQDQLAALTECWRGHGADTAREFLRRHGEASAAAVAGIRTAADVLTALRDALWRAVDGKAAATVALQGARRADWLAAAQTVTTGMGDRAAAAELVDSDVRPFVDMVVGSDWLAAMRTALRSVLNAYDGALAELAAQRAAVFKVPAEIGPPAPGPPYVDPGVPAMTTSAATSPTGWAVPATVPPAPVSQPGASAPTWSIPTAAQTDSAATWARPPVDSGAWAIPSAPPLDPAPTAPMGPGIAAPAAAPAPAPAAAAAPAAMPSLGGAGGGAPDIAGGISGFVRQLTDALGSLIADTALRDLAGDIDAPGVGEPGVEHDAEDSPDEDEEPADEDNDLGDEAVEEPAVDPLEESTITSVEPRDESLVVPPAPAAAPAATEVPASPPLASVPTPATPQTACEIAAEELPQAGQ